MALEVRHCRALIAVADEGGVARAASALGLAQSTLSETLISLERAVGTRIVLRQRGVEARLTPAAHILLAHARRIVAAAEEATAAVAGEASTIRVGAVESISSYFLPGAIHAWRRSHPHLKVEVTTGLCGDLRSKVKSGRLDVAVLLSGREAPPIRGLVMRRLATRRLRLVANHAASVGERLDPATLGRRGILVTDPHGPLNDLLKDWFSASGAAGSLVSVGSLDAVKHGVVADGGIGLLPDYVADHEIAAGAFAEADRDVTLPAVVLEAITASASRVSAIDELIEAIARAATAAQRPRRSPESRAGAGPTDALPARSPSRSRGT